jgi:phosphotriesterase-related protein
MVGGVAAAILRPGAGVSQGAITPRGTGMAQAVSGPLDASKLGFTLAHEHVAEGEDVLVRWPNARGGRAELIAKTVEKLKFVRAAGVSTIVDLTPYDVGRDIRFLEEISRKSGLNMVACTGQRFFPPNTKVLMPARTIEGLAEYFVKEIEQGIDGTAIKAGVIKIGIVGKEPTPLEETGLRAAIRASKATGVAIRIHTHSVDRAADHMLPILEAEGMNPARVSFDHSDDSGEMDYYLGLVRRGYSLGMDHVHRGLSPQFKPSFERRAECIKLLIDSGFANKMFFSQDSELGGWLLPDEAKTWREKTPWDPPEGLLFVTTRLIPYLKRIGISDQSLHTITVENPRSFFCRT